MLSIGILYGCASTVALIFMAFEVTAPTRNFLNSAMDKEYDSDCVEESVASVSVHITISSLLLPVKRRIELNWMASEMFEIKDEDVVVLYRGEPYINGSQNSSAVVLKMVDNLRHKNGYYRTLQSYSTTLLDENISATRCTEYWICYQRQGVNLARNCLMIAASWMMDNRDVLGGRRLTELMLPGTHNSGTYKQHIGPINRLSANQNERVWNQLQYGIRYLDLRVGYKQISHRGRFWVYHDFLPIRPIYTVIADIRRFLESSKEIIVLDFHRFPKGFDNDEIHIEFVQYLRSELGKWMAEYNRDVTLDELWTSNKRLIVGYANTGTMHNTDIWRHVVQKWGDVTTTRDLMSYLNGVMRDPPLYLWAAMAQLTPRPINAILHNHSLRDLAQLVNRPLTIWFERMWCQSANVVATDFFLGNNIIQVAIAANQK